MKIVYPNLQIAMVDGGVTVSELAKIIDKSEEIVQLKLSGVRGWTLLEAVTICRHLEHPDLRKLFLR